MATNIVQMTDGTGNKQYPVTSAEAVGMPDGSGNLTNYLDKRVTEYNVSVLHPTSGSGGSNKYTLETAIAQVPSKYRSVGIKCAFINEAGQSECWEYVGTKWVVGCFTMTGAKKISDIDNSIIKRTGAFKKNNLTGLWSYNINGKISFDSGSNFYGICIPVNINDTYYIKTVGGGKAKAWFISDAKLNILEESIENLNSLANPVELKVSNELSSYLYVNCNGDNISDFLVVYKEGFEYRFNDINDKVVKNTEDIGTISEKVDSILGGETEKLYIYDNLENKGYGINAKSGAKTEWSGYNCSNFIDITNAESFIVKDSAASSFGVAFYSESSEASYISGVVYTGQEQSIQKPLNANYIRFCLKKAGTFTIKSVSSEGYTQIKELKILGIGNSFTRDSYGYLPFILRSILPNIRITVGIIYWGGCSLQTHLEAMNDGRNMYYDKYDYKTDRWVTTQKSEYDILNDENWDIITLQQSSLFANQWNTYYPYVGGIIKYMFNNTSYSFKVGWLMAHIRGDEGDIDTYYSNMIDAIQKVVKNFPVQFVFPVGTAIQNARNCSLKTLGDYSGGGNLVYSDGQHLQQGIPCLIGSYTVALSLFTMLGFDNKSVINCQLRVSDDFDTEKNIPEQHGNCVGIDNTNNYLLAQECAVAANKSPYEVSFIEEVVE